jgi:uncharacterized delta-60 repeat protein
MGVAGGRQSSRQVLPALVALGAALVALVLPGVAWGAAGALDPSFSGDGIVTSTHDYQGDGAGPVAIDSHGRIVVSSEGTIERYTPNGTPDKTFSGDGQTSTTCGSIAYIAIDSQDRILTVGSAENPADPNHHQVFAVARLRANGTPDLSFSGDGCVLTPIGGVWDDVASGVTIDPQGRIVVSGYSYKKRVGTNVPDSLFAVARYLPNGSPDTSFSGDGQLRTEFPNATRSYGGGVAIDSKGRIVVAGSADDSFAVARYGPAGGLDHSFSGDGMVTTAMGANRSAGGAVAIDDSDRIVVAGRLSPSDLSSDLALARYRPNGALDPSFSGDGKAFTSFGRDQNGASDLAIDPQGRIVVSGWAWDEPYGRHAVFALARFTPAGSLDPVFSSDGRVTTMIGGLSYGGGVALDPAGRIVVGGSTRRADGGDPRIAVARYLGG